MAPADGVDDVRLAAAVRPDDARDVVVEVDDRTVDERLEAADLELLDLHQFPFGPGPRARAAARVGLATHGLFASSAGPNGPLCRLPSELPLCLVDSNRLRHEQWGSPTDNHNM